jgi:hypothetical protein
MSAAGVGLAIVVCPSLAELGDGPLLELVVDEQVDPLVVEGDQPGDLLAFRSGVRYDQARSSTRRSPTRTDQ